MDNKKFKEEGTKRLAELQPKIINKNCLLEEVKDKMKGLDKARNFSRFKALQEVITLIEDSPEV